MHNAAQPPSSPRGKQIPNYLLGSTYLHLPTLLIQGLVEGLVQILIRYLAYRGSLLVQSATYMEGGISGNAASGVVKHGSPRY